MSSTPLKRSTRVWAGALDQLFSSASNGLITYAIAVVSTPETFGHVVVAMTALLAVLSAQRGAFGTPLLLKADQPVEVLRREGSYALVAALLVAVPLLCGMLAVGRAAGVAGLVLAISAPWVCCQDMLRFVAIAEGRSHVAAIWDGVWFVGSVVLLVSAWMHVVSTAVLLAGWGALAAIAFVGMAVMLRVRPRMRGFAGWIASGWPHRIRFGADAGLDQLTIFAMLSVVAAVLSASGAATIRGATALLAPVAILAAALQLVMISESTRSAAQPRAVWMGTTRLMAMMAVMAVAGGTVLCLLPESVGGYLLGESFASAQQVLPVMIVEYCATAVIFALGVFLKTFNRSVEVIRYKVATMVVTLVFATVGALVFHSAIGVAVSLAVGTIFVGSLGLAWFAPWRDRPRAATVDVLDAIEVDPPTTF
jgi:hypothetical protein